jgi:hypothetical protein
MMGPSGYSGARPWQSAMTRPRDGKSAKNKPPPPWQGEAVDMAVSNDQAVTMAIGDDKAGAMAISAINDEAGRAGRPPLTTSSAGRRLRARQVDTTGGLWWHRRTIQWRFDRGSGKWRHLQACGPKHSPSPSPTHYTCFCPSHSPPPLCLPPDRLRLSSSPFPSFPSPARSPLGNRDHQQRRPSMPPYPPLNLTHKPAPRSPPSVRRTCGGDQIRCDCGGGGRRLWSRSGPGGTLCRLTLRLQARAAAAHVRDRSAPNGTPPH